MRIVAFVLGGACLAATPGLAQISPPGLGQGHTAAWGALGISRDLDSLKKWRAVSYIGLGRKSNPTNYNPLYKSDIIVLNHEVYWHFHPHWQSSLALSYRRQNAYEGEAPFAAESPAIEQEFRLYSRLSYLLETPRLKLTPTFRQEFRKFFTPAFTPVSENFQLRSRLRLQLSLTLDAHATHRLVVSSEQLFSASKLTAAAAASWKPLAYRESRFVGYYSVSPKSLPVTFDIGYMANLLADVSPSWVHYLACDAIWKLPYRHRQAARP